MKVIDDLDNYVIPPLKVIILEYLGERFLEAHEWYNMLCTEVYNSTRGNFLYRFIVSKVLLRGNKHSPWKSLKQLKVYNLLAYFDIFLEDGHDHVVKYLTNKCSTGGMNKTLMLSCGVKIGLLHVVKYSLSNRTIEISEIYSALSDAIVSRHFNVVICLIDYCRNDSSMMTTELYNYFLSELFHIQDISCIIADEKIKGSYLDTIAYLEKLDSTKNRRITFSSR